MTIKHVLPLLVFTFLGFQVFSQVAISGGAGITHVTGDPDNIVAAQDVSINESNICYDRGNQIVYFFDPTGTAGVNQWNGVSVASFTNTDTRLTNPTVSGGNLVFDILNVVTNSTTGAQVTIPILSIAPVQNVTGGGDITVTSDANGNFTVTFNETTTSLSLSNGVLTYTDEDGEDTDLTLPTSDGSDTKVEGASDITVTGTGTTADPYSVSFTETTTTLTFADDVLTFTDEDGVETDINLPTSDGSDTQVEGAGDITVTGSGTAADPYSVSFSETTTSLSLSSGVLTFTDEDGTETDITLPTSDGSDTKVEGAGDITVTGTGTTADPYSISYTETTTSLSLSGGVLTYTDEDGADTELTLPTSDGSDTKVEGDNGITVTGSGTEVDPYSIVISGAADATEGQIPVADGDGNITWSSANITSIAADSKGKLIATLSSGATVIFDLNSAPRVSNMSDLDTAAKALESGQTGIAVVNDGNTLGIPAMEDVDVEIGALFFIKKK